MRLTEEVRWVLKGQTPDQIPMARLAEYMAHLAVLFGEQNSVHFARVEDSSVAVIAKIDKGAALRSVQQRISRVRLGTAPTDARKAFDQINAMVTDDNGSAQIKFGQSVILRFPGVRAQEWATPVTMHDQGTITGKLYAMSENSEGEVGARIRPRVGVNYIPCTVAPGVVKELRGYLTEAVRVHGRGFWERSPAGEWTCKSFHIVQVSAVKDTNLREAIGQLRAIDAVWRDDPLGYLFEFEEQDGAA